MFVVIVRATTETVESKVSMVEEKKNGEDKWKKVNQKKVKQNVMENVTILYENIN